MRAGDHRGRRTRAAGGTSVPEQSADLRSPRGDKVLHWELPRTDRDQHSLQLIEQDTKTSIPVLTFPRHVSVGWAPAGTAFFVTDYGGSDFSRCLVFVLDGSSPRMTDISDTLRHSGLVPAATWNNHHLYCEVLRWLDDDDVLIRLHGYGDTDPRGFNRRYRYSLNGTLRPAR